VMRFAASEGVLPKENQIRATPSDAANRITVMQKAPRA
jgi:hypothetical protein